MSMELAFSYIGFIILMALVFDFLNGFHDAANSIATVVSTRVMSPKAAVLWAAFFNFVALFVFGLGVAKTLGKGMIDVSIVTPDVVLGGLIGAIFWNLVTWYYGIPVSSSHALIGGYAGAAVAKGGFAAVIASGWTKTLMFIVLSPIIGAALGFSLMVGVTWIFRKWHPYRLDKAFRRLQLLSAAFFSLNHGGNDAQKTMGIIASLLVASGQQKEFSIPYWVACAANATIGLGTMFGGWRIVKTMGSPAIAAWSFILVSSLLPLLPLLARGKKSTMHWIGYATLALFSILLTVVVAGDFFRLAYWIIVRARG